MSYPVNFVAEPPSEPRDRAKAFLRPVLVIPHAWIVGGPLVGFGRRVLPWGALGLLAMTIAIFDWVAILISGHPIAGLRHLKHLYLQWRARLLAYGCFLCDEYPPFGEASYPAFLTLPDEPPIRDRASVALRPILLFPHLVVLAVLLIPEFVVCIASWLLLTLDGRLDERIWRFSRDVVAYLLRVESYALLVHDEYPPFRIVETDEQAPASPLGVADRAAPANH